MPASSKLLLNRLETTARRGREEESEALLVCTFDPLWDEPELVSNLRPFHRQDQIRALSSEQNEAKRTRHKWVLLSEENPKPEEIRKGEAEGVMLVPGILALRRLPVSDGA